MLDEGAQVVFAARIEARASDRRELAQALLAWATAARQEAGALDVNVYEDIEAPAAFCLMTRWESRQAMQTHLRGPQFGVVLGAFEVLARPPDVLIADAHIDHGGEVMRQMRRPRDREHGRGNPA